MYSNFYFTVAKGKLMDKVVIEPNAHVLMR